RKTARRITRLIAEIQRDPFDGIGKPEPLKGELAGYWSRRSDDEHLRQSVPHVAQFGGRELDVRRVAG
ncbi:Txe/YoeB family addiction module toxin, partial [Mycobacterium sp. Lab-001]|uniref:Txe/YoeB family addiction module toxin n=1 Tax=Mycobacterium sp. Lab-001 TaxID=3410136 RepID=UPI003D1823A8